MEQENATALTSAEERSRLIQTLDSVVAALRKSIEPTWIIFTLGTGEHQEIMLCDSTHNSNEVRAAYERFSRNIDFDLSRHFIGGPYLTDYFINQIKASGYPGKLKESKMTAEVFMDIYLWMARQGNPELSIRVVEFDWDDNPLFRGLGK